jgi:hypothetical protein
VSLLWGGVPLRNMRTSAEKSSQPKADAQSTCYCHKTWLAPAICCCLKLWLALRLCCCLLQWLAQFACRCPMAWLCSLGGPECVREKSVHRPMNPPNQSLAVVMVGRTDCYCKLSGSSLTTEPKLKPTLRRLTDMYNGESLSLCLLRGQKAMTESDDLRQLHIRHA